MTKKGTNLQPRREFLKLAALTGAAALTGTGAAGEAEQTASAPASDRNEGDDKMEFLHVSGRHIVDTKGEKVRAERNLSGRLDEHGGFY